MSELEMKIEALIRCVGDEAYKKAMSGIKNAEPKTEPVRDITDEDIEQAVHEIMVEIGIPAHLIGYRYISTALRLVIENPDIIRQVTKGLYPTIAQLYGTTPMRVERAIRHAIESAWDRGDLGVQAKYFGYTVSRNKGKPTNSEFLAMVGDIVRRNLHIR